MLSQVYHSPVLGAVQANAKWHDPLAHMCSAARCNLRLIGPEIPSSCSSRTRQIRVTNSICGCNRRDSTAEDARKTPPRARYLASQLHRILPDYEVARLVPYRKAAADRRGGVRIFKVTCLHQQCAPKRLPRQIHDNPTSPVVHAHKANTNRTVVKLKRPSARSGLGTVSKDRNVRSNCRCSCVLQFTS